jgi:hypothetical protein
VVGSPVALAVRAATTRRSAVWPSGTKSLVPERTKPPSLPGLAPSSTPAASQRALSSVRASVARASPPVIFGSQVSFWAAEPASRTARPPRSTVEK